MRRDSGSVEVKRPPPEGGGGRGFFFFEVEKKKEEASKKRVKEEKERKRLAAIRPPANRCREAPPSPPIANATAPAAEGIFFAATKGQGEGGKGGPRGEIAPPKEAEKRRRRFYPLACFFLGPSLAPAFRPTALLQSRPNRARRGPPSKYLPRSHNGGRREAAQGLEPQRIRLIEEERTESQSS